MARHERNNSDLELVVTNETRVRAAEKLGEEALRAAQQERTESATYHEQTFVPKEEVPRYAGSIALNSL